MKTCFGRALLPMVICVVLLAPACTRSNSVVIGSKNFTEQLILGEILAQAVENPGQLGVRLPTTIHVNRKLNLGGTFVCHQALIRGQIDAYPEYTGTALTAIFHQEPIADSTRALAEIRAQYARLGAAVSQPLGFNDTFAILVRGDDARAHKLATISDLARVSRNFRLGIGYEFMERQDGFQGLTTTYGLHFNSVPVILDLGLLYRALADKKVDVIAGNATDGRIDALGLVQLKDDRRYFAAYQAVFIYRKAKQKMVEPVLDRLAGTVDDSAMRRMNAAIDLQAQEPNAVARQFLASVAQH